MQWKVFVNDWENKSQIRILDEMKLLKKSNEGIFQRKQSLRDLLPIDSH